MKQMLRKVYKIGTDACVPEMLLINKGGYHG